jgi:hypothetical protein
MMDTERPKDFIKKLLELESELGKVARCKIGIQKVVAFLNGSRNFL